MNDQHRQQLVEQYEDIAFSLLMDDYAAEEGAKLLKEFEAAEKNGDLPAVPDDLDEKCRKLIDRSFSKRARHHLLTHIAKSALKAVVSMCVILGIFTVTVLSVDALRVPVLNFFLQHTDLYTSLSTDVENSETPDRSDSVEQRLASLISGEYRLVVEDITADGLTSLYYMDEQEHLITLFISPSHGNVNIDTEGASVQELELNGLQAIFIEKDGYRLVWADPETQMFYDLYANGLDSERFWELAYALAA